MLTEQNSGNEELLELDATSLAEKKAVDNDPARWQPLSNELLMNHNQSIDHFQSQSQFQSQQRDVFSMLINLYGSRDTFINEYRNMLADRLLLLRDYETASEVLFSFIIIHY